MTSSGWPQGDKEEWLHYDWKQEVRNDNTILGFREWVANRPPEEPKITDPNERCPF